jgi:zinc transporter ZupT
MSDADTTVPRSGDREVNEAAAARPARRPRLPLTARNAILTAHIVFSVGLLGDSAGYLAVAVRTSTLDDPALVHDSVKTLNMFSLVFGIPLSFAALLTGLALGLGTRWGVFRYPWVVAKLVLIVTVLLVGGLVIAPASDQMLNGEGDRTARLIAAAAYDVVALAAATSLGVFKPGRPFRRRRAR